MLHGSGEEECNAKGQSLAGMESRKCRIPSGNRRVHLSPLKINDPDNVLYLDLDAGYLGITIH